MLARQAGYRHYAPNGGDVTVALRDIVDQPERWLTQTGCFGPLRIFVPVPQMEDTRILVHLRDPRDVLVSMFYSYCYAHGGEVEGGQGVRREVADRGIDDFVLQMATAEQAPVSGDYGTGSGLWDLAGNVRRRYEDYLSNLHGQPNSVFVRYEDMISDPTGWLSSVVGAFGDVGADQTEKIIEWLVLNLRVDGEDRWAHKRQVIAGDHKNKLRPETICRLNETFGDVLDRLGYGA